jgi:aryl-alcohol dehydrogenase-like predicted oxidoreductase
LFVRQKLSNSFVETATLAPGYTISRVIRGGWQLAGGHGPVDPAAVEGDLLAYYQAGITTFDCADIYTGVEEMIGAFRAETLRRHGAAALDALKIHTKFVPDIEVLPRIDKTYVRSIIERSLKRLNMERLDLVQFHWWDYAIPGCIETALWLTELQREGKIDLIGGTNFDLVHLKAMVEAGVPLKSMQVQYSLLDDRPVRAMAAEAQRLGVALICYGTIAGGFVSERSLGQPEPQGALENRSLTKYKLIIDDFGGWPLFQELLATLRRIAKRHGVDIAAVASRWALDQPNVAAVIVGARNREHLPATLGISTLRLTDEDRAAIAYLLARRKGPAGEVFALERDRNGRHGVIMKYNLNA